MPRFARLVRPGAIFHITARGNYRQQVFFDPDDYEVYMSLLGKHAASFQVRLLGWCLMINHVHLLVSPHDALGMAQLMKRTQGEYALYLNRKHHRASGHLWQSRYYSALVSPDHVWMVLRYIERNPVGAQLITEPGNYALSSAKHHLAPDNSSSALDLSLWAEAWSPRSWAEALREIEPDSEHTIREATRRGYPIGSPEFIDCLQNVTRRNLIVNPVGRPRVDMRRNAGSAIAGRCSCRIEVSES